MTEEEKEQREEALAHSDKLCPVCGKSIYTYGTPQFAHKIAYTKANLKKYGTFYINHFLNGEYVCSLKCNDACNIGFNQSKILSLLADILKYEIEKFTGVR